VSRQDCRKYPSLTVWQLSATHNGAGISAIEMEDRTNAARQLCRAFPHLVSRLTNDLAGFHDVAGWLTMKDCKRENARSISLSDM